MDSGCALALAVAQVHGSAFRAPHPGPMQAEARLDSPHFCQHVDLRRPVTSHRDDDPGTLTATACCRQHLRHGLRRMIPWNQVRSARDPWPLVSRGPDPFDDTSAHEFRRVNDCPEREISGGVEAETESVHLLLTFWKQSDHLHSLD
ncbi:hypothetical protein CORC01_09107 [Colletotrichum orchidophilum]|uniref:Uncharacterized protein n=1 Tax=Colletotrichum orchidophilum TaxID=1209926 RepID=A0A1G4B2C0_9PEZI|nr:uncharacterized protein CORC01_09107 [Colletotrichum orchidophilum]OHE95517.1 hypothetical protein CORC01_09107 [Colletotrichum orchidophilum]